ncbi:MAG: Rieske (2Fe-2S) protein [Myxococcota bacterium]
MSVPAGPPAVAVPTEPDGFVDACAVSELAEGEVAEFIVGGTSVALVRASDGYHALGNVCPHAGGPIGDGDVEGDSVRCPLHGWGFDIRTGTCEVDPSIALRVYRVRERSGRVEVEIPETLGRSTG